MPRSRKKPNKFMADTRNRLAGLKSIDENLDLGNGLTITAFSSLIDSVYNTLEEYNTILAQADQKSNEFDVLERQLRDTNERFLLAVAVKYGKSSNEYEMAGGTRKSERKRPTKKTNNSE